MARFDLIETIHGGTEMAVNLTKAVGTGAPNQRSDVLLIQALFNYIGEGLGRSALGLGPEYRIPAISGVMDAETYSAIGEFQIANIRQLLINRFDGVIHPANYKGRKINLFKRPLMSITYLHLLAKDASIFQGSGEYPFQLSRMNEELAFALDAALVG